MTFGKDSKDHAQIRRAVIALKSFVEKSREEKNGQKQELIENPDVISIQFALRKIPDKGSHKPYIIDIPHSLHSDVDAVEMCLIVKDGDKERIKEQLKKTPVPGISKVIPLKKLKTHYGQFKERRELCASYDLFLADDRILPLLPKALGKVFFAKKKQPIPVRLSTSNKKMLQQLNHARDTTTMFISTGPCIFVKIGKTNMETLQIVENIVKGIQLCVDRIPRKWKNIQSIQIKTHDSVALPIFSALPELGKKLDALPVVSTTTASSEKEDETTDTKPDSKKRKLKSTSAKTKKLKA